jgi:hypothetical protein
MKICHLNKLKLKRRFLINGERSLAGLSRKTTIHGPRRTIQAGKRQVVIKLPSSLWRASPDRPSFVKTTKDGSPDRQDAFPYPGKVCQVFRKNNLPQNICMSGALIALRSYY